MCSMRVLATRVAMGVVWVGWLASPSWGQLDIAVNVTPVGGGGFHYEYALTNTGPADVAIVSIAVPPDPLAVANLVAPAGFGANFDPGLGFLDFFEGTQAFVFGVRVDGFAFDSPLGPGAAAYSALDINGMQFNGTTTAPVPEPAAGLMLCAALAVLGRGRRRRV